MVKDFHKITAPPDCYQIDVVNFPSYVKKVNKYNKFLVLIEILSRQAFVYPLRSNKMTDIIEAYEEFIDEVNGKVVSIEGDDEFNNKSFQAYNDELGVVVISDVAKDDHITKFGDKLGSKLDTKLQVKFGIKFRIKLRGKLTNKFGIEL